MRNLPKDELAVRVVRAEEGALEDRESHTNGSESSAHEEEESSDEDIPLVYLREPEKPQSEEDHADEGDTVQDVTTDGEEESDKISSQHVITC